MELPTKRTNQKPLLARSGSGGAYYEDFIPFLVLELRQHFGIYILVGLCPSPQAEYKSRPQYMDPIHRNDFVYKSLGTRAEWRHRHFKAFFARQNLLIETSLRKDFPNWKIKPLLTWMDFIFRIIWLLGLSFFIVEMTIGFKGKHNDKRHIMYKAERNSF